MTDADFAAGFQRDPELFTAVYDRYFRDVYRYVAGRLDTEAADDIAAETFLVAFGQRARFDPGRGGLRPWLFGIATNLVARHRRKEARHYAALARQAPEPLAYSEENRIVDAVARDACVRCWRGRLPRCPRGSATWCCCRRLDSSATRR